MNKVSGVETRIFWDKKVSVLMLRLLNSLAPGRSECDSKNVIFNLVLLIGIFRSSHDNALRWMTQDLTDDKSTLVQVMAWCRQAASHYLSQCWLSSLSPCGVTRPQWVKSQQWSWMFLITGFCLCDFKDVGHHSDAKWYKVQMSSCIPK